MKIIYALQSFPKTCRKTIFLAGPSPRGDKKTGAHTVPSWRPEAIAHLRDRGFDGDVYVPEPVNGKWSIKDYDDQFDWENEGLERADRIVFWVPRTLDTMPAFTTNHEHGEYFRTGKTILGAPGFMETPKMRYLVRKGKTVGQPQVETLEGVLELALAGIGEGAFRSGGETQVPIDIWRTTSFQGWYRFLLAHGNRLDRVTIEWSSGVHPGYEVNRYWILDADIFVAASGQVVKNQLIRST